MKVLKRIGEIAAVVVMISFFIVMLIVASFLFDPAVW